MNEKKIVNSLPRVGGYPHSIKHHFQDYYLSIVYNAVAERATIAQLDDKN